MNFRELIDREARYKDSTRKPRSMAVMAKRCGFSRQHLYKLFDGTKTAPEWTVARIARRLGLKVNVVQSAIDRSRKEGLDA